MSESRAAIEVVGSELDERPICVRAVDPVAATDVACRLRIDDALELAAQLLEVVAAARRRAS